MPFSPEIGDAAELPSFHVQQQCTKPMLRCCLQIEPLCEPKASWPSVFYSDTEGQLASCSSKKAGVLYVLYAPRDHLFFGRYERLVHFAQRLAISETVHGMACMIVQPTSRMCALQRLAAEISCFDSPGVFSQSHSQGAAE